MRKNVVMVISVLFLSIFLCGAVSAAEWNVTPGGSIQEAINNASSNDIINVEDGGGSYTYNETVVVNKNNLTVRGVGQVTVSGSSNPSNPVFTVNNQGSLSSIIGFTIADATGSSGVLITGTNDVILTDLIINNCQRGISLTGTNTNTTINQVNITNTTQQAIWLEGTQTNTIINNTNITNSNAQAIYFPEDFSAATNVIINNTRIVDCKSNGIEKNYYKYVYGLTITNTQIINPGAHGIWLNGDGYPLTNVLIDNTTVTQADSHGIYIRTGSDQSQNLTITNTTSSNNGDCGLYLYNVKGTVNIADNILENNSNWGIWLLGQNNPTVTFENNTLTNNTNGLYIQNINGLVFNQVNNNIHDNGGTNFELQNADNTTIENLTFNNTVRAYNYAVFVVDCDDLVLQNLNIFNNSANAIYLGGTGINTTINQVNITNSTGQGILMPEDFAALTNVVINNTNIVDCKSNGIEKNYYKYVYGLTITNTQIINPGAHGIWLNGDGYPLTNLVIDNTTITQADSHGIYIRMGSDQSQNMTINNTTSNNSGGCGLYLTTRGIVNIINNTLTNNGDYGVWIMGYNYPTVTFNNNTLTANGNGMHIQNINGLILNEVNNNIHDNGGTGYYLQNADNTTIENLTFNNNVRAYSYAVFVVDCDDLVLQNLNIFNNSANAIYLGGTGINTTINLVNITNSTGQGILMPEDFAALTNVVINNTHIVDCKSNGIEKNHWKGVYGLAIINTQIVHPAGFGVLLNGDGYPVTDLVIGNTTVTQAGNHGVYVRMGDGGSLNLTITNSTSTNNGGCGFYLTTRGTVNVTGNVLTGNSDWGILVNGQDNSTCNVTNNTIVNNGNGLCVQNIHGLILDDTANTIHDNGGTIYQLDNSDNSVVENLTFDNDVRAYNSAVVAYSCDNLTLRNLSVLNSGQSAIVMGGTSSNTLISLVSIFGSVGRGIYLGGALTNVTIDQVNITNSTGQAIFMPEDYVALMDVVINNTRIVDCKSNGIEKNHWKGVYGLAIINTQIVHPAGFGVWLNGDGFPLTNLVIDNVTVNQAYIHGMYIRMGAGDSQNLTITNTTSTNNGGCGFYLTTRGTVNVTDNVLTGNSDWGILVNGQDNSTSNVTNNTIVNNGNGLCIQNIHGLILDDVANDIHDNGGTIYRLDNSDNSIVENLSFNNDVRAYNNAVVAYSCDNLTLRNLSVLNSGQSAIILGGTGSNALISLVSIFASGGQGIYLGGSLTNVTIDQVNITNSTGQAIFMPEDYVALMNVVINNTRIVDCRSNGIEKNYYKYVYGLTITNTNIINPAGYGVWLNGDGFPLTNLVIDNVTVNQAYIHGMYIRMGAGDSQNLTITNTTSTNNGGCGFCLNARGIVNVANNTLTNNGDWGIWLQGYNNPTLTLENNTLTNNGNGLYIQSINGLVLNDVNNNIHDNGGTAYYLRDSDNTTIENISFNNNVRAYNYAVFAYDCDNITLQNLNIFNNSANAIYLGGTSTNTIINLVNITNSTGQAIFMPDESLVLTNVIINNTSIIDCKSNAIEKNNYKIVNGLTIINTQIINPGAHGIWLNGDGYHLTDVLIDNTTVTQADSHGIYIRMGSDQSQNLTINNTTSSNNGDCGLYLYNVKGIVNLTNNTLQNNSNWGIWILGQNNPTVTLENNTLTNNGNGLYIQNINGLILSDANNNIHNNGGTYYELQNADNTIIENISFNNNVRGYNYAVYASNTDNLLLRNLNITNSTLQAIFLTGTSTNTIINQTNITKSGQQGILIDGGFLTNVTINNTQISDSGASGIEKGYWPQVNGITIENTIIEHPNGCGILLNGYDNPVSNIVIKNTMVTNSTNSDGIHIRMDHESSQNAIISNTTSDNNPGSGLTIYARGIINIADNNSFYNNAGWGAYLVGKGNPTVTFNNNTLTNNTNGLYIRDINGLVLSNTTNNIHDNGGTNFELQNADNTTIENLQFNNNLRAYNIAVYANNADNLILSNLNITNSSQQAIFLTGTSTNTIINLTNITNSGQQGVLIDNGLLSNIIINNTQITDTGASGIEKGYWPQVNGITIENTIIEHPNGCGILLNGYDNPVSNIVIKNTTVTNSTNSDGIHIRMDHEGSQNAIITGTTSDNNPGNGFTIYARGIINITDNSFDNNAGWGAYLVGRGSPTVTFNNNTLTNNNNNGLYLQSINGGNFQDNQLINNTGDDLYSTADTSNTFTRLTMGLAHPTTVTFDYINGIIMSGVENTPADPAWWFNLGKYVDMQGLGSTSVNLKVYYTDADIVGLKEEYLSNFHYNSGWSILPEPNGVNTADKYVYANGITSFSTFAPLGVLNETVYVDGVDGNDTNDGYTPLSAKLTINAGIGVALNNWSVYVFPNTTYNENVLVNKDINLLTLGAGNVDLNGTITINSAGSGATIEGFNITPPGGLEGITITSASNVDLANLGINNAGGSVVLSGNCANINMDSLTSNNSIGDSIHFRGDGNYQNIFINNSQINNAGVNAIGTSYYTLTLNNLTLQNTNITNPTGEGIHLVDGNGVIIRNITINNTQITGSHGTGMNIQMDADGSSQNITLNNSTIDGCTGDGGIILGRGTITLNDNSFKNNGGWGLILQGYGTTITTFNGNRVENNTANGIHLENIYNITLTHTAEDNGGLNYDLVNTSNITITDATLTNNIRNYGAAVVLSGTCHNITISNLNVNNTQGDSIHFRGDGNYQNIFINNSQINNAGGNAIGTTYYTLTLNNLIIQNTNITNSTGEGVHLVDGNGVVIQNIIINNTNITGSHNTGMNIQMDADGLSQNITLNNSTIDGCTGDGGIILGRGTISFTGNSFKNNGGWGLQLQGIGTTTTTFNNNHINNNTANGINLNNIHNITLNNATQDNGGINYDLVNTNNITITDTILTNNVRNYSAAVVLSGTCHNITISNLNVNNTQGDSIHFRGDGNYQNIFINNSQINNANVDAISTSYYTLTLNNLTIQNTNITNSTGEGIHLVDGNGVVIQNITINNTQIIGSHGNGMNIQMDADGSSHNFTLTNSNITNSSMHGVCALVRGTANITGNNVTGNGFAGGDNTYYGLYLEGIANPAIILSKNVIMENRNGIFLNSVSDIHFNRIVNNNNHDLNNGGSSEINATNNWWGSNVDPSGRITGNVNYTPWLVLHVTLDPQYILLGCHSTLDVDLTHNSWDEDTSSLGYVPDGLVSVTSVSGNNIDPNPLNLHNGKAQALVEGTVLGNDTVNTTFDMSIPLNISVKSGPILNEDSGEEFTTIQEAVDDLDTLAGQRIAVANGTYAENISVNKPVTIKTCQNAVVNPANTAPVFIVNSGGSGTIIRGFNITGGSTGIYLNSADNCTITGNNITGNSWSGIGISNSMGTVVEGNNVSGNQEGIYILGGSSNNTITRNTISGNQFSGICVDTSQNTAIIDNSLISGNGNGIRLYHSTENLISGNNLPTNIWCAIALDGSSNNLITGGNLLTNNVEGIHLMNNANNNTIMGTIIVGNSSNWCGISIWNSSGNNLTNNRVSGKQEGIYLTQSASYNTLEQNNVQNNLNSAICLDSSSQHNNIVNNTNINLNGNGIRLAGVSLNTVSGNVVTGSVWAAICLDNASDNTVSWNTVSGNQEGIYIFNNANNNTINNNTASGNAYSGICVNSATGNNVTGNNVTSNGNGIRLYNYADNNIITDNMVGGQGWAGIVIDGSYENQIHFNTMESNGYGLYSKTGSSNNQIYQNNFINNPASNAYEDGTTNTYDNGVVGNYWSDYGGSGPYLIQIANTDNNPSLTPF